MVRLGQSWGRHQCYDMLSMREARIVDVMAVGLASLSLNTLSITDISVDVVSIPQNALQSFTTNPAATTSLPEKHKQTLRKFCNFS